MNEVRSSAAYRFEPIVRMGLNDWAREVYQLAKEKGFRSGLTDPKGIAAFGVYVANFHAEASELWEAARDGNLDRLCDKAAKMVANDIEPLTCIEEELADMIIRCLDIAALFGIDIERAVRLKHEFNKTRPFMHGKKA